MTPQLEPTNAAAPDFWGFGTEGGKFSHLEKLPVLGLALI
jgi:hypothetical protein